MDIHALRLEPGMPPNLIGGFVDNTVSGLVRGGTIGGGGEAGSANRVTDDFGTIGGGRNNQAGDNAGATTNKLLATVGDGGDNEASGFAASVPGGLGNTASGGSDDKSISTIDADGVALAAIQGLNQKLEEQLRRTDNEITELKSKLAQLKEAVSLLANPPNGGARK